MMDFEVKTPNGSIKRLYTYTFWSDILRHTNLGLPHASSGDTITALVDWLN